MSVGPEQDYPVKGIKLMIPLFDLLTGQKLVFFLF